MKSMREQGADGRVLVSNGGWGSFYSHSSPRGMKTPKG